MKHYELDEFINDEHNLYTSYTDKKDDLIDKKVSLLYDFCILTKKGYKADAREKAVRELLSHYNTEFEMTRVLHTVLVGDCHINQLIGGVLQ